MKVTTQTKIKRRLPTTKIAEAIDFTLGTRKRYYEVVTSLINGKGFPGIKPVNGVTIKVFKTRPDESKPYYEQRATAAVGMHYDIATAMTLGLFFLFGYQVPFEMYNWMKLPNDFVEAYYELDKQFRYKTKAPSYSVWRKTILKKVNKR